MNQHTPTQEKGSEPLLLHFEDGTLESVTVCELDPHVELWVLMSVLDPFWGEEEV